MKNKQLFIFLRLLIATSFLAFFITSCTKDEEPEGPGNPGTDPETPVEIETTHTIQQVLGMYDDSEMMEVVDEVVFKGTVISSDSTGNVYKYITLQDAGYGIQVKLNKAGLYSDYSLGQTVYVKAKGLYLGHYGGTMQIGGVYEGKLGNIDVDAIDEHIVAGAKGSVPSPNALDLANLPEDVTPLINTWVSIASVQFDDAELGKTYAESEYSAYNRTLVDVKGNTIVVRTSQYAEFASQELPEKSGTISAILTVYNGTLQLTLNKVEDVAFAADRFTIEGAEPAEGTGTLEDAYNITAAKQNLDKKDIWVRGFIIGSVQGGNIADGFVPGATDKSSPSNLILASSADETDPTKGIPVQLSNGSYIREMLNVLDNQDKAGTEVWIKGNIETYFGTAGLKGTSDFSFDGKNVETEPVSGIIGMGDDILGSALTNTVINFMTYNVVQSEEIWTANAGKASINGYNNGENHSWMISKAAVDFSALTTPALIVKEFIDYAKGLDKVQVKYSTNYTGTGSPTDAEWMDMPVYGERTSGSEVTTQFDASTLGAVYVAFVYTNTDNNDASSWTIESVVAGEKEDDTTDPTEPTPFEGLINGDFEGDWDGDKPSGWSKAENTELVTDANFVKGGSKALKHTGGTKDIAQTIAVTAGKTYEIHFWYKVSDVEGEFDGTDTRIWSQFKKDGSTLPNKDGYIYGDGNEEMTADHNAAKSFLPTSEGEWVEFKKEYVAPEESTELYFEMRTYKGSVVYYDEFVITEKN